MKVLVPGCAGFIGWKVSEKLLDSGCEVVGIDSLNQYYDVRVKRWRLERLEGRENFKFFQADVEDYEALNKIFEENEFDAVINEAAMAGVRNSIRDPWSYLKTNAYGTLNLLELMKEHGVQKFVLASTSSLYAGMVMPFREDLPADRPLSPYAASKKAAEVIAYTYHYLYDIDVSVLRYFTVYGPAGRPDMSVYRFIYWIMKGNAVEVFGSGEQSRDFTYIDDIAEGTIKALKKVGYEIINLGSDSPRKLMEVIKLIEECTGKKAKIVNREFHRADMKATWADITKAKKILDWKPRVTLEEGIKRTVEWFEENWSWVRDTRV